MLAQMRAAALAPVLAACLWLGVAGTARADGPRPEEHIRTLGGEAISMLSNRQMAQEQRLAEFRRLLAKGFDLEAISRFVLGRYWRQASDEQRAEYGRLFEEFIIRSYANRLGQYSGETFAVRESRVLEGGEAMVASTIERPSGPPIRIDWRLRRTDEQWRIIDVVVEGISMAITQRQEFAAVIQKHGGEIEPLLVQLRQRSGEQAR